MYSPQTGRYPIHNTIDDYIHVQAAYGLPLNETTMPSLLKKAGYACHATGKWQ
jgi:arylsulfatase A-like enzyme